MNIPDKTYKAFPDISNGLKGKNKKITEKLLSTYKDLNGNDDMLTNAFIVWKIMRPSIKDLSVEKQLEIIHQTTMIAYDARISAFDHMKYFNEKINSLSIKELEKLKEKKNSL